MFQLGRGRTHLVPENSTDEDRERRWTLWIRRMATGDTDAFSAFYDESSSIVFSFVLKILHDREDAEDALVEIYNRARRQAASFDVHRQDPLVWLIQIARDIATKQVPRAGPFVHSAPDPYQHKRIVAVSAAAELSAEERSIIEMTYMSKLSAVEVADLLEMPTEYVRRQIVSAMRKLRAAAATQGRQS